jgi:hypothetical protein
VFRRKPDNHRICRGAPRCAPTILLVFLLCRPSFAATYFVTQSGAGSKNGTSVANAWSAANYNASSVPTGGDNVLFSGSMTSTVIPNTSGTSSSVLTLDFTGATLTAPAISFGGKSFIAMQGGQISADTGGKTIINCTGNASNIVISGFKFTGSSGNQGTDDFLQLAAGCSNLTISNNTMDQIEHLVVATGGLVQNLNIANNFARSSANTVDQTDVLFLPDSKNITIEGNKLIEQAPGQTSCCHNDVIQVFKSGAAAAVNPSNLIIRYNWLQLNVVGGSGDNSWMEITDVTGQPAMRIYGNVYVGTGQPLPGGNGISIHTGVNASDQYYFYNNTVYRHQQPINAIRLGEGDGPGILFSRNNVGSSDADPSAQMLQWTFSAGAQWNRNFFSNFGNCSATFSGPNGSCSTSPQFTDAANNIFSLKSGSPLINAGDATIGAEFNQGIAPTATWPNPALVTRTAGAWDVGAYQFTSGAPPPPPPSASTCDVNNDGTTNVVDVQQEVNQALGIASCTADINKDGQCTVVDVQRVVNAALGGQCVSP